ncbi:unnamed protein product, partial [Ixodes hexagonus]
APPAARPAPPVVDGGPPPPPPPPPPQAPKDELLELLAASPVPQAKMRSLNWTKIPAQKVLSGPNLWRRVAQSQSRLPQLDFGHLEGLFCQPPEGSFPRTAVSRMGDAPGSRAEPGELRLLDAQRSLHLGIFLKQLRGQGEELLDLLSLGGGQLKLGAERVRSLLALLPSAETAPQLEKALGDAEPGLLAPPEAFLARLLRLPNYRLRIESLLLQEELPSVVASLESSMTCLRKAAREIQDCDALHQILFLILVAGNFLNSGGYAGNAAGFRVMSLLKVIELRSNRPGVSLLHYVAQQADRAGLASGLSLATLEPACRVSGDQVRAEVAALAERLDRLRGDAARAVDDQHAFLARTDALLALAQRELERLRRSMRSLDKARAELADFFCEDLVGFTLEECFRVLATFCRSFKAAVQDNQRRAADLSPLRCPAEVRLRDEHGGTTSASSPDASPSGSLRRSFRISRPSSSEIAADEPSGSPPTRRSFRASRPSSSELGSEDQLMDFLRQSTSDREDSLGRRSRREARRRIVADTFDDGSRERGPSTDAKVTRSHTSAIATPTTRYFIPAPLLQRRTSFRFLASRARLATLQVPPQNEPAASATPTAPAAAPAAPAVRSPARTPARARSSIPTMPGSSVGHRSRRDAAVKPFMRATSASTARSGLPDRKAPPRTSPPAWRTPQRDFRGRSADDARRSTVLSRA